MNTKNNKNTVSSIKVKPVQPRYINLNEDIFTELNANETRVYLALRYQADYRSESSDVQLTINELIKISKVKRSSLFCCLRTLEDKFFLIRRLNWEKGTFGQVNEYEIAQHLYYFKPIENEECEEKNINDNNINEEINGSYIEGVHHLDGVVHHLDTPVHHLDGVVHEMHTVKKAEYQETYYQKNEQNKSVLNINQLMQNNPHNLPGQMIEDWLCNRKAKKAPVTQTAWGKLNKELSKCKNPIDAFEECVGAGWLSIKAEWIDKPQNKNAPLDHDTIGWAKGMSEDIF